VPILDQAGNGVFFHCDVLIDVVITAFYCNHIYVGVAKILVSLWEEEEIKKQNIQLLSPWKRQIVFILGT